MTPSHAIDNSGYPSAFVSLLDDALQQHRRDKQGGALMLVSIDNLAMIMRGYGNATCETIMLGLLEEIREVAGSGTIVQRIQRDQFGIIIQKSNEEQVSTIGQRIAEQIKHSSCYSDYAALHIRCSVVGVAFHQAESAIEALDQAFIGLSDTDDLAYYSFEHLPDQSASDRQEMGLANYLNKAIQGRRLRMAYQPIVCSKTGQIVHYEALLRLMSEDGTISSAGPLIPIAERMGLIDLIDRTTAGFIVEELRQAPDITLAFNVSNLTTRNQEWLAYFTSMIEETPEIAQRAIIEITETAVHQDLRHTAYFVAALQALGCKVSLDDFGSGYTSFRQLKTLSVDLVKIDGAFVKDLVDNADNRFFVKTLLDFTNGFGLKAVAEYVESGEIAKMLMDLGVDYLQGYYFGRPLNSRPWRGENDSVHR